MSNLTVRRIVEAFFRRWPLYLLLAVAAAAFGFVQLRGTPDEYSSTGALRVDGQSLVTAQSGLVTGSGFGYLSPAQYTSQEIYGLMATDVFMESVTTTGDIELHPDPGVRAEQLRQLRLAVAVFPSSGNIVQVVATTGEPDLSARLATSIIDSFIDFQIGADIAESGASEEFFAELAASYQEDLDDAQQAVDDALRRVDDLNELTAAEQLQLSRLQEAELLADDRYREAVADLENSRLASLQTETDIRQTYTILDSPQAPSLANGRLLDQVLSLAMYVGVGLILMMIGPVVLAMLDRTVIFPEQLREGALVAATVPRVSRRTMSLVEAEVEPLPGSRLTDPIGPRTTPTAPVARPALVPAPEGQANGEGRYPPGLPAPVPQEWTAPAAATVAAPPAGAGGFPSSGGSSGDETGRSGSLRAKAPGAGLGGRDATRTEKSGAQATGWSADADSIVDDLYDEDELDSGLRGRR